MTEPELGKTAYNNRLESIRGELATLLEVNEKLGNSGLSPAERYQLLHEYMLAVYKISDDVLALEKFGRMFKETGELDPKLLEGKGG